jgi:hypothetical protein
MLRLVAKQLITLRSCSHQAHQHLFVKYPNLNNWLRLLGIGPLTTANTSSSSKAQQQLSAVDSTSSSNSINFHDFYECVKSSRNDNSIEAVANLRVLCERKRIAFSDAELQLLADSFRALCKCC